MIICNFESFSYSVQLHKSLIKRHLGCYWITITRVQDFKVKLEYISLDYPKKQAFVLFIKMCNWLLTKR